jgi:hypothetical protein
MLETLKRISPSLADKYIIQGSRGFEQQKTDRPDDRTDNLFEPIPDLGKVTSELESALGGGISMQGMGYIYRIHLISFHLVAPVRC